VGVVIEPLKHEFGLSDASLGALNAAFALAYVLFCLPLAALADRANRRNLLAACLAAWSGLTALCGAAQSFAQLLVMRALVGASEAGGHPASLSVIADLYRAEARSSAVGVYGMGPSIAGLFAFALGGWITAELGWRATFLVVGLPGVVLAAIVLRTTREPARGAAELRRDAEPPRLAWVGATLWKQRGARWLMFGLGCFVLPYASLLVWLTSFFSRSHHAAATEVGLVLGLSTGLAGLMAALIGGRVADRLASASPGRAGRFLALTYLACAPAALVVLLSSGKEISYAAVVVWAFCSGLGTGPQFALIQGMVGLRMRARATAIVAILMNLSYAVGPQLVGVMSDGFAVQFHADSLRISLACGCAWYLAAFSCVWWAGRFMRDDMARAASGVFDGHRASTSPVA
jgi:predicted MFS family arabinose efflux permease